MTKGDETRARILRHAARVASRDGLGGLSIGELAAQLEMSKSGLFAHFGSKEDLQLEVLRAASADFSERVISRRSSSRAASPASGRCSRVG